MLELVLFGGIAVAGVIGFAIHSKWSTYNRIMALDERCTTAFADVDALLKHRHDLIPSLVENLRSLVGQENHVMASVLQAINETSRATSIDNRLEAETNLGNTINNIFSQVQNLPQARTSQHFVDLRNSFKDVENRITAARRYYNNTVQEHNSTVRQFPGNVVARKHNIGLRHQYTLGAERIFKDEAVSLSL